MKSGKLHAAAVTPAVKPSQPEQQLLLHCKLRLPMLRLMKRKEKCWGGVHIAMRVCWVVECLSCGLLCAQEAVKGLVFTL